MLSSDRIVFKMLQILAKNVPPPYGFKDLLQRTNKLRLCQRHDSELRYFCKDHEEELCADCWSQEHREHDVELLKVNKWKRLSSPWENRRIQVKSILEFDFKNFFLSFFNTNWFAGGESILSGKCGKIERRSRLSGGTEKQIPKNGRFVPLPNAKRNKNESTIPGKTSWPQ